MNKSDWEKLKQAVPSLEELLKELEQGYFKHQGWDELHQPEDMPRYAKCAALSWLIKYIKRYGEK